MIARELNEQGISTIKGNPWTSSSVMGIINNEKYKGLRPRRFEARIRIYW